MKQQLERISPGVVKKIWVCFCGQKLKRAPVTGKEESYFCCDSCFKDYHDNLKIEFIFDRENFNSKLKNLEVA